MRKSIRTRSTLETLCGKCVALQTEVYMDEDGTCKADPGTIEYTAFADARNR